MTVSTEPLIAQIYFKRFAPDESGNFPPRLLDWQGAIGAQSPGLPDLL